MVIARAISIRTGVLSSHCVPLHLHRTSSPFPARSRRARESPWSPAVLILRERNDDPGLVASFTMSPSFGISPTMRELRTGGAILIATACWVIGVSKFTPWLCGSSECKNMARSVSTGVSSGNARGRR